MYTRRLTTIQPVPCFVFSHLLRDLLGLVVAAILFSNTAVFLDAQTPYSPRIGDPLKDKSSWKSFEGPYLDGVHCIDVAASGNLWFGVWRAAHKYDGGGFTRYPNGAVNLDSKVRFIKETLTGEVYAATDRTVYRLREDSWSEIGGFESTPIGRGMYEASDGTIWFVTSRRLVSIVGDDVRQSEALGFRAVDMTIDRDGFLWVVGGRGVVVKYARVNGEAVELRRWSALFGTLEARALARAKIESTTDGRVWLITSRLEQGPLYLDKGDSEWSSYDLTSIGGSNRNFSLIEYAPGEILISGEDYLYRMRNGDWTVYDKVPANVSSKRSRLFSNGNGYVWLWLVDDRLTRVDLTGNRSKRYLGLNFQCELDNGDLCFITEEGHAVIQDVGTNTWMSWDASDGVISDPRVAVASPYGLVWYAGSHDGVAAVSAFDGTEWTRYLLPELGVMVSHQSAIVDSQGGVLFGSGQERDNSNFEGGIVRFSAQNGGYQQELLETGWRRIVGLAEKTDGSLVAANRLIRQKKREGILKERLVPKRMTGSWVDDFLIVEDGGVWFSSWGRGVTLFSEEGTRHYTVDDDLDSNYVSNLLKLSNGNILALSERGLSLFDGQSWRSWDGLVVSGVREGSSLRETRNGEIWVNTANRSWNFRTRLSDYKDGEFETLRYVPDRLPPQTFVEVEGLEGKYSRSAYVIWSGRDQWAETPAQKLEYSFRLNGGDWSHFSGERTQFFPNLDPGDHLVEVRARDRDGNIDLTPSQQKLSIIVPFWQTKAFLYVSICGVIVTIALVVALVVQRFRHIVEVDRMRIHFLTNISHELRSPLALIIWPLEKIRALVRSEEEKEQVNIAYRNAKRLNELVEQLLDYRKAEEGTIELCPKDGDIVAFLKVLVSDFHNLARSRQQDLKFYCDEVDYWTAFDQDVLQKIVDNLISNALKFSPDLRRVVVSLRVGSVDGFGEGRLRISVEDEGIGVEKSALKKIFEPFYCSKNKAHRKSRSYGVGLALVKELVTLCSGDVSVESPIASKDGKALGSRFSVELPGLARTSKYALEADVPESVEDSVGHVVPFESESIDSGDTVILIVDDHEELRNYVAAELEKDYKVFQTANGASGLKKAIEVVPDVILSDVVMPEMDGVDFCRRLRENPLTSHIPVILQTSLGNDENEAAGLEAGAVDYVTKPVPIPVLKKRIANHLDNRKRYADYVKTRILTPENLATSEDEGVESAFIERVREVLKRNWDKFDFNAEILASEMGMSRSSFYRKFNAVADTSPAELIKNFRLDKAAELLANGSLISEVSDRIGYSERSPFYRAFKKRFGCSPSDYRKRKGA